jgi:hypothetical protein
VPQFLLARKPFGLHRAYPGSYLSDRATYPHIEPPPLSFPVPYSEFGLTLEREKEIVSFNYRNTPVLLEKSLCGSLPLEILSVHIISFELQKKQKQKKSANWYTLSTLLAVFSISHVASSVCFVFSTIIQLCIIV